MGDSCPKDFCCFQRQVSQLSGQSSLDVRNSGGTAQARVNCWWLSSWFPRKGVVIQWCLYMQCLTYRKLSFWSTNQPQNLFKKSLDHLESRHNPSTPKFGSWVLGPSSTHTLELHLVLLNWNMLPWRSMINGSFGVFAWFRRKSWIYMGELRRPERLRHRHSTEMCREGENSSKEIWFFRWFPAHQEISSSCVSPPQFGQHFRGRFDLGWLFLMIHTDLSKNIFLTDVVSLSQTLTVQVLVGALLGNHDTLVNP